MKLGPRSDWHQVFTTCCKIRYRSHQANRQGWKSKPWGHPVLAALEAPRASELEPVFQKARRTAEAGYYRVVLIVSAPDLNLKKLVKHEGAVELFDVPGLIGRDRQPRHTHSWRLVDGACHTHRRATDLPPSSDTARCVTH